MNTLIESFAAWAWQTSLFASVLILFVLVIQRFGGRILSPRWRYALSLLVLVRLIVPAVPESGLSIFNFAPVLPAANPAEVDRPEASPKEHAGPVVAVGADPIAERSTVAESARIELELSTVGGAEVVAVPVEIPETGDTLAANSTAKPPAETKSENSAKSSLQSFYLALQWLPIAWICGVLGVAVFALWRQISLVRWLRRSATPAENELCGLLDECRRKLAVRQKVELLELAGLGTVAICGVTRPKILVPAGLRREFDDDELCMIFMHELAHLKKGDLILNWLIVAARALHWFNPLVWLGTARLMADRELVRDAFVIDHLSGASKRYGETLLKLLCTFNQPCLTHGATPILKNQTELKRRLTMLTKKRHLGGRLTQCACIVLITGLSAVTFTAAVAEGEGDRKERREKRERAERLRSERVEKSERRKVTNRKTHDDIEKSSRKLADLRRRIELIERAKLKEIEALRERERQLTAYERAAKELRAADESQYDFTRAKLDDVLRFLADDAGISFIVPAELEDIVTFSLKSSPFEALETIARENGIELELRGSVWHVSESQKRQAAGDVDFGGHSEDAEMLPGGGGEGDGLFSDETSGVVEIKREVTENVRPLFDRSFGSPESSGAVEIADVTVEVESGGVFGEMVLGLEENVVDDLLDSGDSFAGVTGSHSENEIDERDLPIVTTRRLEREGLANAEVSELAGSAEINRKLAVTGSGEAIEVLPESTDPHLFGSRKGAMVRQNTVEVGEASDLPENVSRRSTTALRIERVEFPVTPREAKAPSNPARRTSTLFGSRMPGNQEDAVVEFTEVAGELEQVEQQRDRLEQHVDHLTREMAEMRKAMRVMQQEIARLRGGRERAPK